MLYFQDPSAMIPVNCLDIKPDYTVLDLCASPGGKTFQLSLKLPNGLLVSNEVNHERNKVLQANIERLALNNVILSSLQPSQFKEHYPNSFDIVLVDAPCSGEGMFRKYPESINEWSKEQVTKCSYRQKEIIDNIIPCIKENGYLIYSTCTFNTEENEEIIEHILNTKIFELMEVPDVIKNVTSKGIAINNDLRLRKCRRIYPHLSNGEGQFVALLKRISPNNSNQVKSPIINLSNPEKEIVTNFLSSTLIDPNIPLIKYKNTFSSIDIKNLYIKENGIVSCGVKIGDIVKNRIIPHHHFFKAFGQNFKIKLDIKG